MNSNCPAWLYSERGVRRLSGDNGAHITDYNDPNYISEAVEAIQALGARYNNDPRIHAFELGLLGYWGEWHTSGFKSGGVGYQISSTAQDAVLNAYKNNFTRVPVQGRYPWREPLKSSGWLGFHNDYFVPNNGHSDDFDNTVAATGVWMNGPIGGEAPPRSAAEAAAEVLAMYTTPKGESMIRTGHYSSMAPGAYRQVAGDPYFNAYMQLHRLMGYNYQIESASFANSLPKTSPLTVELKGKNIGIAPTHYAWNVQFSLLDGSDKPVVVSQASLDLKAIKPQDAFTVSSSLSVGSLNAGTYRLAVRIIQPGADITKVERWKLDARNTYILFANDMSTIAGSWGVNNALDGGWSVLGQVSVR